MVAVWVCVKTGVSGRAWVRRGGAGEQECKTGYTGCWMWRGGKCEANAGVRGGARRGDGDADAALVSAVAWGGTGGGQECEERENEGRSLGAWRAGSSTVQTKPNQTKEMKKAAPAT